MNGKAGRLVDGQDGVVFVHHVKVERHVRLLERGTHEDDDLAGADALTGTTPAAIGAIGARLHDLLRARTRESRNAMLNEAIKALPGVLGSHREGQQDRSGVAARRERNLGTSTRP